MQSLLYVKASDGVANASLMTVSTVRSAGASTILTNTVANAPVNFYATMGTPHTFSDPVTGETITVISDATAVDFAGRIDSGHVEIVAIAPGYTDLGSAVGDIIVIRPITEWANNIFNVLNQAHQDDGKLKTTALDHMFKPSEIVRQNFVSSGGVVALTSGLTGSFSDIVYYINGLRYTKTSVPNKTYTASKDTYVDIDSAGTVTYSEVTIGSAAPALAANSVRLAKVVTSGSAITSVVRNMPDANGASSNWIYPTSPNPANNDTGWIAPVWAAGWTNCILNIRRVGDRVFTRDYVQPNSGNIPTSVTTIATLQPGMNSTTFEIMNAEGGGNLRVNGTSLQAQAAGTRTTMYVMGAHWGAN